MRGKAVVAGALVVTGCLGARQVMAIEQPRYRVVAKQGDVEVREYDGYLVAETEVEGDFGDAGNEGFRRLFRYIDGDNAQPAPAGAPPAGADGKGERVAMTAPVEQRRASAKIPMTAPVEQRPTGGRWVVAFVVPSRYTLATVPRPSDPRVSIREVPPRRVAVRRFSGGWDPRRFEEHRDELLAALGAMGLAAGSEPVYARYNPPFWPSFLRRNEVQVEVVPAGSSLPASPGIQAQ